MGSNDENDHEGVHCSNVTTRCLCCVNESGYYCKNNKEPLSGPMSSSTKSNESEQGDELNLDKGSADLSVLVHLTNVRWTHWLLICKGQLFPSYHLSWFWFYAVSHCQNQFAKWTTQDWNISCLSTQTRSEHSKCPLHCKVFFSEITLVPSQVGQNAPEQRFSTCR